MKIQAAILPWLAIYFGFLITNGNADAYCNGCLEPLPTIDCMDLEKQLTQGKIPNSNSNTLSHRCIIGNITRTPSTRCLNWYFEVFGSPAYFVKKYTNLMLYIRTNPSLPNYKSTCNLVIKECSCIFTCKNEICPAEPANNTVIPTESLEDESGSGSRSGSETYYFTIGSIAFCFGLIVGVLIIFVIVKKRGDGNVTTSTSIIFRP